MEKNGYNLSRKRFEFRYSNSHKCKALHTELYFYIIDLWNRLGQKDVFGLPTQMTMEILGVGSYNTYNKAYLDLIEFGFVKEVEKSKNQHTTRRVAISNIDKATDEALYKATYEATDEAHTKATDTIDKQINKETKEQMNNLLEENKNLKIENKKLKDKLKKGTEVVDTEKEKEIFTEELINYFNDEKLGEYRKSIYDKKLRYSFFGHRAEPFVNTHKHKGHIRKFGESTRDLEKRLDTFLRNKLGDGETIKQIKDKLKKKYGIS